MCVIVQSPSHLRLFVSPWTTVHKASLSSSSFRSLLKLKLLHYVAFCPFVGMPLVLCSLWWSMRGCETLEVIKGDLKITSQGLAAQLWPANHGSGTSGVIFGLPASHNAPRFGSASQNIPSCLIMGDRLPINLLATDARKPLL